MSLLRGSGGVSPRFVIFPLPEKEGIQDAIDADEEPFALAMVLHATLAPKRR